MALWWMDVLKESRTPGLHSPVVRLGLRYGMTLFITSEVMFFVGFFWAFFHFALFPEHVLDATGPAMWPPAGIETFDPFHLPFLNTMILLLSGCTVTWAHHALLENDRRGSGHGARPDRPARPVVHRVPGMEYSNAPFKFDGGGVYPAVFFLATGFHGFHVIVGTCFLIVCWFRAKAGQFTPQPAISGSRPRPGTGTSWTWSGCSCSWRFTGGAPASSPRSRVSVSHRPTSSRLAAGPLSALRAGQAVRRAAHHPGPLPGL